MAITLKDENPQRKRRSNSMDDDTQAMIFDGLNLTQLAKLFRMERRDVAPKLREVGTSGTRGGYPIYYVHEVAPHLVKPIYDIETYIMRMHHNDLPKHVSKEFWNGLLARQKYQEEEGDLWRTESVIETLSEVFKQLRMSFLLMGDALERETTFTDFQRDRLRTMVDGALNEAANGLIKRFNQRDEEEAAAHEAEIDDDEI